MINITLKCQGKNICKKVHSFHHYPTWFLVSIFVLAPICLPTTNTLLSKINIIIIILLLSLNGASFFCQKHCCPTLTKKLDILNITKMMVKKTMAKTNVPKLVCPKWHFGQVGQGSKRSNGLSLLICLIKKTMIFCN